MDAVEFPAGFGLGLFQGMKNKRAVGGNEGEDGVLPMASMTGFSRAEGLTEGCSWMIEARSVNGRTLDIRCRLPSGFEMMESVIRAAVQERFRRGSVSVTVLVSRGNGEGHVRINRAVIAQLQALAKELGDEPPSFAALLAVRGVVEVTDENDPAVQGALEAALQTGVKQALDGLAVARLGEGRRLKEVLGQHVAEIRQLVEQASGLAAAQPAYCRDRLLQQLVVLLEGRAGIPEERLAQEAALLAARSDVREEINRLQAHLETAGELLDAGEPVGRKLDFLCQEFNREANTLCAKAQDVELSRTGLALKNVIDQLREQVQNIE
jgi:uncharacterized protein (TIGR00255 family)